MRITKLGHACVRIEHDGTTVVIDPGMFTDPGAVDGADAILITHEHPDHYTPDHLLASSAPIYTIHAVAAAIAESAPAAYERVTVLAPGASFGVGAIPVRCVGELHAVIHPDLPGFFNSGYLLTLGDRHVFHPGDALTAPGTPVDVLCAPSSAPWLKASEAINFVREVGAPRNLAIHDRIYTDAGHTILAGHMERLLGPLGLSYTRLADGDDLAEA